MRMKVLIFLFPLLSLLACAQKNTEKYRKSDPLLTTNKNLDTAYFAAGCFWCVEAIFESIEGVEGVVSGYTGGHTKNPSYEDVCSGRSGHAEAVMVIYNKYNVAYDTLLSAFFNSHDPSTLNSQGPDFGTQYRSAIYYTNEKEKLSSESFVDSLDRKKVFSKITTEIKPLDVFWEAEIYHQNYKINNPENSYIQQISVPRLTQFKATFKGKLKN
jgi:peptide-methionine (S)-S-oxide reductase